MTRRETIEEIRRSRLPTVICGAGVVGEALLSLCREEGIDVECFCDSSVKVAGTTFCGLEVLYTPDLKERYEEATILISVASIKDVVDLLQDMGFHSWHAGGSLLKDLDIVQSERDPALDYTKFALENCILCHDGFLNPDALFLRSVDLIITERCSLKCRDCSNLMQYYERPGDLGTDQLLRSIDAFCEVVDEVMDFRILGGDAFMNRQWPTIVRRLTDEPRARRVVLYTNGTIMPLERGIPVLKHPKVLMIITDYGELSRKMSELRRLLQAEKIAYHVLEVDQWLNCSGIERHDRTGEQARQVYEKCCAKNMLTLSGGKLFRCPYAANAHRLSAVPDHGSDYVDLFREPLDASTRRRVRDYVLHKGYLETCDFCSGRPLSGEEAEVAVQTRRSLPYTRYGQKPQVE